MECRQRQTEADRGKRQRQTEADRGRQRQTKADKGERGGADHTLVIAEKEKECGVHSRRGGGQETRKRQKQAANRGRWTQTKNREREERRG
jgi:hypothetical protein